MPTQLRYVGDMPVEERQLDGAGEEARAELNARVLQSYEASGAMGGAKLREAVFEFETYAAGHVLPD